MSNEELLERVLSPRSEYLDGSSVKNMLLNIGRQDLSKAELLHRLNEAERLREALEEINTSVENMESKNQLESLMIILQLRTIAKQALTTPEGDKR